MPVDRLDGHAVNDRDHDDVDSVASVVSVCLGKKYRSVSDGANWSSEMRPDVDRGFVPAVELLRDSTHARWDRVEKRVPEIDLAGELGGVDRDRRRVRSGLSGREHA